MARPLPAPPVPPSGDDALGEQAWIEVIQKMDEVYNDLLQYEVALEEKNAALEESHQFIESVLASISDILIVCDRDGAIIETNPALQHFTGRAAEALVGTPVFDLFADEGERARARHLVSIHGRDGVHDCELHLRAGDGTAVPVSLNCTPRLTPAGKLMGLVLTGRPVGELRRAYQQLRQAHEDLKRTQGQLLHAEKMASLGRLVAGVAHELNNPISFVLGNVLSLKRYAARLTEYLGAIHGVAGAPEEGSAEPAALRQRLRIDRVLEDMPALIDGLIEGAERTRDIVDALKRFSAVDKATPEPVNLTEVIQRAVHWVEKSAPPGFRVVLDLPVALPCAGSSGQLQQVAMNLVQNAVDACAGRTDARLEIRGGVTAGEGGQPATIAVHFCDNGAGISPESLPHLFEPFFTTKPVGQGTGLGLSISYGIVERHGGNLTASIPDTPDGGACFTLTLPAAGPLQRG